MPGFIVNSDVQIYCVSSIFGGLNKC